MNFAVGMLIKARGREWVVLPGSNDQLLMVRPLGGSDVEVTGLLTELETIEPASFDLPDPTQIGDYRSCRMLRDALQIGFRSSAGPFRSFGNIAVEPRPYQLVPLLMALKLDPVRLLIADDVGIGKTIEACLIARELIDRGEIERMAVLCPPQLAEQWQKELSEKFHIDAELVLSSTAARLERKCRLGESLFEHYPYVVVSMDFIKSDRRRDEFLRTAPEFVIVDEVHTCAFSGERSRARHQRHQLVAELAAKPKQNLVLVTATPHSGKEDAFRSLLTFLDPEFVNLPMDLTGKENEHHRRKVAQHFVQRKRVDIQDYLGEATQFPKRIPADAGYRLTEEYKQFFEKVLRYARETVQDASGPQYHQRVRWWSALALLRALASSPVAAASLRTRAANLNAETVEEVDEIGRTAVLDLMDQDTQETFDMIPGSDVSELMDDAVRERRRLLELAREADRLQGEKDAKLQNAIQIVKGLIDEGYNPILFCRFIPTVDYIVKALREHLPKSVEIIGITGLLPPAEREERINKLAKGGRYVLVSTDCLSEGINLQEHFNSVVHYDLSWNPTRHEQREGRVDRFGQASPQIKVITYYGLDNQIDGVVLDVLLRKHQTIRNSLGISVPVPVNTDQVVEAIFEGLLLRGQKEGRQLLLPGFEEWLRPQKESFYQEWDQLAEREKRSRTLFAQISIKVDDVMRELQASRKAIGSTHQLSEFIRDMVISHGGGVSGDGFERPMILDLRELPRGLKDLLGNWQNVIARFDLPVKDEEIYLSRTHPFVKRLATYVLDTALDPLTPGIAKRSGVIRTRQVQTRTTLLLCRFRYHIITVKGEMQKPLLAEDSLILGFEGSPTSARWLDESQIEPLLDVAPDENISPEIARDFVGKVVNNFDTLWPHINAVARDRGEELLEAHQRVRTAAKMKGVRYRVEPILPPDVLGIYIYLPI